LSITTAQLPTTEPQTLAVGDTAEWVRYIDDFPATSYTLKYVLQGPRIITFNAGASGSNYLISLTSAVTRQWKDGLYRISAYVVNADASIQRQVRTAFERIVITPNLAVTPNGVTPLSFAEKGLEAIEATILQLTTRTVQQASVNGQVYTLANIQDLFLLRERFKSEVRREEEQARLNAGLGAGNKIGVRFRPLTWTGYPTYPQVPWQ
jgi:hypothetical protein